MSEDHSEEDPEEYEVPRASAHLSLSPLSISASASVWPGLDSRYMMSARHLCTLCAELEEENKEAEKGTDEIEAYAISAVLLSFTALEAYINTVYIMAARGTLTLPGLSQDQVGELWERIDMSRTLNKYQLALVLCGKEKMDAGKEPHQSVDILRQARNSLIHFKTKPYGAEGEHANLSDRLGDKLRDKYGLSPFAHDSAPVFPEKCMCHGFAQWAVDSVEEFAGEFASRVSVPNRIGSS